MNTDTISQLSELRKLSVIEVMRSADKYVGSTDLPSHIWELLALVEVCSCRLSFGGVVAVGSYWVCALS